MSTDFLPIEGTNHIGFYEGILKYFSRSFRERSKIHGKGEFQKPFEANERKQASRGNL